METDAAKAFRTHSNYLKGFAIGISKTYLPGYDCLAGEKTYPLLEAVAQSVMESRAFQTTRTRAGADSSAVARIVRNAWGTELLMNIMEEMADDELLGVANNWTVIQAYYATYHSYQAIIVARGQQRPESHSGTLNSYANWVEQRSMSELLPWSVYLADDYCHLPDPGRQRVHNLSWCHPDNCWAYLAMALRTTRRDDLALWRAEEQDRRGKRRRKEWERDEKERQAQGLRARAKPEWWNRRPRVSVPEAKAALGSTTMLDYLYRLRARSNYQDPDMFTEGWGHSSENRGVHRCLCTITSATLLVHELFLAKILGAEQLTRLARRWLDTAASGHQVALAERLPLLSYN